jgi:ParB family chromosome partitioning protein
MAIFEVKNVPIKELTVSPLNARKNVGDITELADSIRAVGLLQPIIVREVEGRLEVVVGQRRFLACKSLGWDTIPAVVRKDMTDREAMLLSLTENVQAATLDPIERAEATERVLEEFSRDMPRQKAVERVAKELGKSPNTIRQWLALLQTTEEVQRMVREKRIDTAVGASLAGVDRERQVELARAIAEAPISITRKEVLQVISYAKKHPEIKPREAVERVMEQLQEFSITISLPGPLYWALTRVAEKLRITIQEVIRRAIRSYIEAHGEKE